MLRHLTPPLPSPSPLLLLLLVVVAVAFIFCLCEDRPWLCGFFTERVDLPQMPQYLGPRRDVSGDHIYLFFGGLLQSRILRCSCQKWPCLLTELLDGLCERRLCTLKLVLAARDDILSDL